MRLFFLILFGGFLSSCAANFFPQFGGKTAIQQTEGTTVIPQESMTALIGADTIRLKKDKGNFVPMKRGQPTDMVLIRSTQTDTIRLPSSLWNSEFHLTEQVITDFSRKYAKSKLGYAHRGSVLFHLSFPYFNLIHSAYGNESSTGVGFLGLALGVDCFYTNDLFLNLSGGGIMDFILPFPAPICYGSGVENFRSSLYATLSNNHMLHRGKLSLGYGITFSHDSWNTIDYGPTEEDREAGLPWQDATRYRNANSLGLIFRFYYYPVDNFFLGLSFRPALLRFTDKTRFKYQHTASIEFGFRIK